MSLFNRNSNNRKTTKGFYIGSPEAEAENRQGILNHKHYYEDFLDINPKLRNGKFIITGRKGAGKSAIAKSLRDGVSNETQAFADLISLSDLEIEKLKQLEGLSEFGNKERVIIEWLVLVRIIKLLVQNGNAIYTPEFKPMQIFLRNNAGIVNIDRYEISEVITNKKYEVSFEILSRVFKPIFGKYFNIKTVRAPFYRLINPLKEVVQKVIQYDVNRDVRFLLLFDDLDVNLKAYDEQGINSITELIRVAKYYNTEIFRNTNTSLIIFMRDDIKKLIDSHHSDTAKIFSSYEIELNWYDHESFKADENFTQLKRFINKRIKLNFQEKQIEYDEHDPWSTLVDNSNEFYNGKTAFKYLLDHSFYRPRDFILFFNSIGDNELSYPLEPRDVAFLLRSYVREFMREIKNELALLMKANEVNELMNVVKEISSIYNPDISNIEEAISRYNLNKSPVDTAKLLCSYSLLGLRDKKNGMIFFSHRENFDLESIDIRDYYFIIHKVPYLFYNPGAYNLYN